MIMMFVLVLKSVLKTVDPKGYFGINPQNYIISVKKQVVVALKKVFLG
jgi:hypothetical protein